MHDPAPTPAPPPIGAILLPGTAFAFTAVPHARTRADGWTPEVQAAFMRALSVMGSVGQAARAVGMGRASAYRLRARAMAVGGGAERFAAAWDAAISAGRWGQYAVAMERAIDGHTIVRVTRGGSVTVAAGPDLKIMNAALREGPSTRDGPGQGFDRSPAP